jgi:hypothetical protein
MADRTPTFSISIEWDNARHADLERSRRMLRRLGEELATLTPPPPEPPQIVFLYDRHSIDGEVVSKIIADEFRPQSAAVRIAPTDGLRYYEQKNLGAARTQGEIVIFLDCDVIPDPGWLRTLLTAFADPEVSVVGGDTYIEIGGLWSKAFALFWFFNLRGQVQDLEPAPLFHANNVAFRRKVFETRMFPSAPMYRGQCTVLGHRLCAEGITILRHGAAGASHPAPRNLAHLMERAFNNGRDSVIADAMLGANHPTSLGATFKTFCGRLSYAHRRIAEHGGDVGLGPIGAVGAHVIAAAYAVLQAAGEISTARLTPGAFST